MQVQTRCPHCSTVFEVPESVLGKRTRCTQCGERFELSRSDSSPPENKRSPVGNGGQVGFDEFRTDSELDSPAIPPVISTEARYQTTGQAQVAATSSQGREGSRKFGVLFFVATAFDCGAILIIALTVLVFILRIVSAVRSEVLAEQFLDFAFACASLLVGFYFAVLSAACAQTIRLFLQVEENTHQTKMSQRNSEHLLKEIRNSLAAQLAAKTSEGVSE